MSEQRDLLVARILARDIMTREDQVSSYQEWFDSKWDGEKYKYDEMPENLHIFFSYYTNYEGDALMFGYDSSKNMFFYVSGGHCSCNGLEGQFDPEDYTFEEMVDYIERMIETDYDKQRVEEYKQVIQIIKGEQA